jgi:hypothetical protein
MKKRSLQILFLLAVVAGVVPFRGAHAAIVTFGDKAAFLSATGATSATGTIPNLGNQGLVPVVLGDVTLQSASGNLFIGTLGVASTNDWTTRLAGNDIAISDIENLDVTVNLLSPTYAFGFDFVEPENDPNVNGPFVDSTFEVRLFDGVTLVDSFTFNAPNDVAAFVGAWGNTAFDNVQVREITGDIGNEFFGEFYAGSTALPEPSSFMVFAGLMGLVMARRHRRRCVS